MTEKTNSEELAFRLKKGIHDDLGPQINKLRFIREVSMEAGAGSPELESNDLAGLATILEEIIESYDRVEKLIPTTSPA